MGVFDFRRMIVASKRRILLNKNILERLELTRNFCFEGICFFVYEYIDSKNIVNVTKYGVFICSKWK